MGNLLSDCVCEGVGDGVCVLPTSAALESRTSNPR
jgi:hypothetical protein